MDIVTKKSQVIEVYKRELAPFTSNPDTLSAKIHNSLLIKKIKFPLLEFVGTRLFSEVSPDDQIKFLDIVAKQKTTGGNVIIGVILRERLANHFQESFHKASEYISVGAEWYVTDIIGERVFGRALLDQTEKALLELEKLIEHHDYWVVRSIGPGIHNAVKWGLGAEESEKCFDLLMKMSLSKTYHVKTGIGWAAKTVAKFHPEIIEKNWATLTNPQRTGKWFLTKVKIGLSRNEFAKKSLS